jgi:hypothetical protein
MPRNGDTWKICGARTLGDMSPKLDSLVEQMRGLKVEVRRELRQEESKFLYGVREGKVTFTKDADRRNRKLAKRLRDFLRDTNFLALLTTPVIWGSSCRSRCSTWRS